MANGDVDALSEAGNGTASAVRDRADGTSLSPGGTVLGVRGAVSGDVAPTCVPGVMPAVEPGPTPAAVPDRTPGDEPVIGERPAAALLRCAGEAPAGVPGTEATLRGSSGADARRASKRAGTQVGRAARRAAAILAWRARSAAFDDDPAGAGGTP
ncbi:MAG: hypothetical protein M3Z25_22800, partial [Actinomycetota bacterium]|nr:hypothetical protein [Actinomycetota bacterium]